MGQNAVLHKVNCKTFAQIPADFVHLRIRSSVWIATSLNLEDALLVRMLALVDASPVGDSASDDLGESALNVSEELLDGGASLIVRDRVPDCVVKHKHDWGDKMTVSLERGHG